MQHSNEMTVPRESEPLMLERLHHDLCTALTIVSTNLALVSLALERGPHDAGHAALADRIDAAIDGADRLRAVAASMRLRRNDSD